MRTATGYSFGPSATPQSLKILIFITAISSIVVPLLDLLSGVIFGKTGLQFLLSLSNIHPLFFWQPLTHFFIMQTAGGVNLHLFISLFFRMYLLWMMGSSLIERFGTKSFFKLYLVSGVLSGCAFLLICNLFGLYGILVSNTASLLAVFVVWAMMNPNGVIFLFFIFPIQVKWLLAGVVGISLLVNLSSGDVLHLASTLTGIISGYIFATFCWGLHTPFSQTYKVDGLFSHYGDRFYETLNRLTIPKNYSKIFDIKSGKPQNDDEAFVDAMLEKISKSGEGSLSWWERHRLKKISKRKQ